MKTDNPGALTPTIPAADQRLVESSRRGWWRLGALLVVCFLGSGWCTAAAAPAETETNQPASHWRQVDGFQIPNLFIWTDTCKVYVLRQGTSALLIDLGDGSVLDHLSEIGVSNVQWVLFTHHHREQCQGAERLRGAGASLAAPEAEKDLFEQPTSFRKMKASLGDKFTIHSSSYVRPPIQAIHLDRLFKTNDTFTWNGHQFLCVDTRGNSPGSMSYLLRESGHLLAFTGDLMVQGAHMHTWFDTEWDYGFAAGIRALRRSVTLMRERSLDVLLPAHGPVINRPGEELAEYAGKLERLEQLYVRGYGVEAASNAYQDKVSRATLVTNVAQVSPHLFKFKRQNFWPNFNLILAESGRGLVVDCGLLDENFLDTALDGLRQQYGLKAIDAIVITHMHGDHFLEAPHLREKWGAQIWALQNMVDKMEHPERFDYSAPIQAYGKKNPNGSPMENVRVDRAFRPGETFDWEGYHFTIDWMPGQTEFALCMHGQIDGRNVAFTGDNIFGDPDDPTQTGHEAMVAHNSAILEEGYIYGAEFLKRLNPDILVGGHSFVMNHPAAFIERYRQWSYAMREAFRALSPDPQYEYWFDPFWVRAEPYRVSLQPGASETIYLQVRNFRPRQQIHRIALHCAPGVKITPSVLEGSLGPNSRAAFPIRVEALSNAAPGVHIIGLDVTLDGQRYGELFDVVTAISP